MFVMNKYYKRRFNSIYVITKTVIQPCSMNSDLPVLWYKQCSAVFLYFDCLCFGLYINECIFYTVMMFLKAKQKEFCFIVHVQQDKNTVFHIRSLSFFYSWNVFRGKWSLFKVKVRSSSPDIFDIDSCIDYILFSVGGKEKDPFKKKIFLLNSNAQHKFCGAENH